MKEELLLLFLFLLGDMVFGQTDRIDQSGVVRYEMNRGSGKIHAELYFDDNESLFVFNKIGMDSLQQGNSFKVGKKDGKITGVGIHISPVDEKGHQIYRKFGSKNIIERFTDFFPYDPYVVHDKWLPMKWTLMDEHKDILGHRTQKAITQFRGRIYIVWFTLEIPVPYGPWKLFGLPGLILEAYDTKKVAGFKATKICYPCDPDEIDEPHEKETKTLHEHVYIRDYINEMVVVKFNESALNYGLIGYLGPRRKEWTTAEDIRKRRQKKLEIIYGWEEFPGDTPNPFGGKTLTEKALEYVLRGMRRMAIDNEDTFDFHSETKKYLETMPRSIRVDAEVIEKKY